MTQMESFRRKAAPQWDVGPAELENTVAQATRALLDRQHADGHWAFELEADVTIPAEYILLQHYLGTIDAAKEQRIAAYLRATQGKHGAWPLFHYGHFITTPPTNPSFPPNPPPPPP